MAKSSEEKLHLDEMKVLDILEQQAKDSIDEIVKKSGFSHQKIWRIVKNLEKKKIIWGYSAITGAEEKGLRQFILLVNRSKKSFDDSFKKEIIFDTLDSYHPTGVKIDDIYLTHGDFDGMVTFYAPDILSAKKLVQKLNEKIGYYFENYLILEVLAPIRKRGIKNPRIKKILDYF